MKFLQHNEIDFKKWDEAILRSPSPLVFAQTFYLNATSPGWCALIKGNYEFVMPVTANKKLGINYLLQPPFTPQLGIFGKDPAKHANEFFSFLGKKYKYIDIELNFTNVFNDILLKSKITYVIKYSNSYAYNSNTKRNIVKAQKLNLICEEAEAKDIPQLSKKYLNPFLKNQLKIKPKQVNQFVQLLLNSIHENHLKTFLVRNEKKEICAMGHFISNNKHAVFLKGTSFDKDAKSGSMHFLMHHAIEHYKHKKIAMFDFGGGQSASIGQFFAGLGGERVSYYLYKRNNLPKAIRWVKK
ncbi:MAG: GNAT family N-acetyltransferase [Bacteroidia bacterium]